MTVEQLIKDGVKRKERAQEKEEWALCFLRDEIYSSTAILAKEMCVGVRGARNVLNRMEKKGLLVKDEVRFMGMKALPLWGITSAGIMSGLEPNEVSTISLRYHTPGRVSPLTIEHTLDVHRCQQHCIFELDCDDWTPTRLMPGHYTQRNSPERWPVYPDGIADYPVYGESELFIPTAVEVERSRKTPARYVQIIKGHLENIRQHLNGSESRYNEVAYFCPTQKEADSLKALFYRLITEKNIRLSLHDGTIYSPENCMVYFTFNSMEAF